MNEGTLETNVDQRRELFSARSLLVLTLLFLLGSGCKGCSEPVGESDFFDPAEFGEYEFDGEPDIRAPDRLLFGDVEVGATATETAEIVNVGREVLKISDWEISDGFSLNFTNSLDAPGEIRPGESVIVAIDFTAPDDEEHRGTLTIDSNDPDEPRTVVELFVNAKFPCLETIPDDVVNFGEVDKEERVERLVEIRNCSPNAETTFTMLGIDGDDEFSFAREPGFETMTLPVGESVTVAVAFQPFEAGEYRATLDFVSDDEFRPEHSLELVGVGAQGQCPTAAITGTSSLGNGGFIANPTATYETIPLDRLALRSDESRAYDGKSLVKWNWSLIRKPQDSAATFANGIEAMENELFLDLAGDYVVELEVWDDEGVQSCNTARVTIHAIADEDIHVQLVWDTPNDPNQNDTSGSDVDLHLLHPNGTWNSAPWDCFWQNTIPDWASDRPPGVDMFDCKQNPDQNGCHDDPSLDIDDVDGWGPENINLNNPEPSTDYAVGVHYFSDHGYSVSFATVRIFIGGVMRAEYRRQRLLDQEFWYVADIDWPSGAISPNGQVSPSFP